MWGAEALEQVAFPLNSLIDAVAVAPSNLAPWHSKNEEKLLWKQKRGV
jgi:hypothetical protein